MALADPDDGPGAFREALTVFRGWVFPGTWVRRAQAPYVRTGRQGALSDAWPWETRPRWHCVPPRPPLCMSGLGARPAAGRVTDARWAGKGGCGEGPQPAFSNRPDLLPGSPAHGGFPRGHPSWPLPRYPAGLWEPGLAPASLPVPSASRNVCLRGHGQDQKRFVI